MSKMQELSEKYPKILGNCYIETSDGWYDILDALCSHLQWNTDKNEHGQVEAVQVKEKFGGLRFYTNGADEYQNGAIDMACLIADMTCESCGRKGTTKGSTGWIRCLCKECREKVN